MLEYDRSVNWKVAMNFSIHMDEETLRQIELLAKKTGKSRNALLNIAAREYVRGQSKREWPGTVARWLMVKGPVKIRNFAGFEAHRGELGELRDVEL
jgi:predicted amino acid racemase